MTWKFLLGGEDNFLRLKGLLINNNGSKGKRFAEFSTEIDSKITSINTFHSQKREQLHTIVTQFSLVAENY